MTKNQTKAVLDNFKIQSYVDSLFESNAGKNQRLQHFLSEYQKVLEQGNAKEFMIYEEFGHGLANFATGNKAVKKVINEMNTNLATYGKELNTYKLMECICDDAAKCACEDAYTHYLASKDEFLVKDNYERIIDNFAQYTCPEMDEVHVVNEKRRLLSKTHKAVVKKLL